MTKEQERIKLFNLNNSNRKIRSKMMRTLKLTGEGDYDKASRMLNETRKEFDKIRVEKMELQNTGLNRRDEVDSSFGLQKYSMIQLNKPTGFIPETVRRLSFTYTTERD